MSAQSSDLPAIPVVKRPRSVTILALMQCLQSLTLLFSGSYLFQTSGWQSVVDLRAWQFLPLALFDSMFSAYIMILMSMVGLIISLALLRLRSWAWLFDMVLQGVGLMAALAAYINHHPNYVGMVTGIIMVLFLNQHEVRIAFRENYPQTLPG